LSKGIGIEANIDNRSESLSYIFLLNNLLF
jgi:hypothetical protein